MKVYVIIFFGLSDSLVTRRRRVVYQNEVCPELSVLTKELKCLEAEKREAIIAVITVFLKQGKERIYTLWSPENMACGCPEVEETLKFLCYAVSCIRMFLSSLYSIYSIYIYTHILYMLYI